MYNVLSACTYDYQVTTQLLWKAETDIETDGTGGEMILCHQVDAGNWNLMLLHIGIYAYMPNHFSSPLLDKYWPQPLLFIIPPGIFMLTHTNSYFGIINTFNENIWSISANIYILCLYILIYNWYIGYLVDI